MVGSRTVYPEVCWNGRGATFYFALKHDKASVEMSMTPVDSFINPGSHHMKFLAYPKAKNRKSAFQKTHECLCVKSQLQNLFSHGIEVIIYLSHSLCKYLPSTLM